MSVAIIVIVSVIISTIVYILYTNKNKRTSSTHTAKSNNGVVQTKQTNSVPLVAVQRKEEKMLDKAFEPAPAPAPVPTTLVPTTMVVSDIPEIALSPVPTTLVPTTMVVSDIPEMSLAPVPAPAFAPAYAPAPTMVVSDIPEMSLANAFAPAPTMVVSDIPEMSLAPVPAPVPTMIVSDIPEIAPVILSPTVTPSALSPTPLGAPVEIAASQIELQDIIITNPLPVQPVAPNAPPPPPHVGMYVRIRRDNGLAGICLRHVRVLSGGVDVARNAPAKATTTLDTIVDVPSLTSSAVFGMTSNGTVGAPIQSIMITLPKEVEIYAVQLLPMTLTGINSTQITQSAGQRVYGSSGLLIDILNSNQEIVFTSDPTPTGPLPTGVTSANMTPANVESTDGSKISPYLSMTVYPQTSQKVTPRLAGTPLGTSKSYPVRYVRVAINNVKPYIAEMEVLDSNGTNIINSGTIFFETGVALTGYSVLFDNQLDTNTFPLNVLTSVGANLMIDFQNARAISSVSLFPKQDLYHGRFGNMYIEFIDEHGEVVYRSSRANGTSIKYTALLPSTGLVQTPYVAPVI
jgi:hypothetical protein